jgi:hypothetical protein
MDITLLAFFHILVLNSLFIVVDYNILKGVSGTKIYMPSVIAAGLISLFLGVYLTNHFIGYFFDEQWFGFSNGIVKRYLFCIGALTLTVCNIVIELPFYIMATADKKIIPALKTAVAGNLITNVPTWLIYLVGKMYYSHGGDL